MKKSLLEVSYILCIMFTVCLFMASLACVYFGFLESIYFVGTPIFLFLCVLSNALSSIIYKNLKCL